MIKRAKTIEEKRQEIESRVNLEWNYGMSSMQLAIRYDMVEAYKDAVKKIVKDPNTVKYLCYWIDRIIADPKAKEKVRFGYWTPKGAATYVYEKEKRERYSSNREKTGRNHFDHGVQCFIDIGATKESEIHRILGEQLPKFNLE